MCNFCPLRERSNRNKIQGGGSPWGTAGLRNRSGTQAAYSAENTLGLKSGSGFTSVVLLPCFITPIYVTYF